MGCLGVFLFALSVSSGASTPIAASWRPSTIPFQDVRGVSVAEDERETAYAIALNSDASQSAAFRSDDTGVSWTLLATAPPGEYASSIAVDPTDARRVVATTTNAIDQGVATRIYLSTDAGDHWMRTADVPSFCDSLTFDRARPGRIIATCSTLLETDDGGLSWHQQSLALALLTEGPDGLLYARGPASLIYRSGDGGTAWTPVAAPPANCPNITALAVDPADAERLFAGTEIVRNNLFTLCGDLALSDDAGRTWQDALLEIVYQIVIDRADPRRIFAATAFGKTFASFDGGEHWRDLDVPASTSRITLSSSGRVLYAITSQGLFSLPLSPTRVVPDR